MYTSSRNAVRNSPGFIRLWMAGATYFGHDLLWPRPTLATTCFGQADFGHGQADFGHGHFLAFVETEEAGGGPKVGNQGARRLRARRGGAPKGGGPKGGGPEGWGPEREGGNEG